MTASWYEARDRSGLSVSVFPDATSDKVLYRFSTDSAASQVPDRLNPFRTTGVAFLRTIAEDLLMRYHSLRPYESSKTLLL